MSEDEIAMVRRLVMNAVKNGKYEALVYSFPSDLCTDSGRAINSADPQWTETLQGKAKQFYERYLKYAKPQGYKLKAMIINFPGGMPGDVGFFLNWAPKPNRNRCWFWTRERLVQNTSGTTLRGVGSSTKSSGRFWRLPSLGSSNATRS